MDEEEVQTEMIGPSREPKLREDDFVPIESIKVALMVHPSIRDRIMLFKVKTKAKNAGEAINKLIDAFESVGMKVNEDSAQECVDGACD